MTEAEALDEAAKAAGWRDWREAHERTWELDGMRAHAATIMENAALRAENERLREALGLLSAVELTIPADRIRDDDHVIITYKTFRALRTALERIDHD